MRQPLKTTNAEPKPSRTKFVSVRPPIPNKSDGVPPTVVVVAVHRVLAPRRKPNVKVCLRPVVFSARVLAVKAPLPRVARFVLASAIRVVAANKAVRRPVSPASVGISVGAQSVLVKGKPGRAVLVGPHVQHGARTPTPDRTPAVLQKSKRRASARRTPDIAAG